MSCGAVYRRKDWSMWSLQVWGCHMKTLDQVHGEETETNVYCRTSLGDVTGAVSAVSTHALRILGGVVDCTRRSHRYSRGHRWSHGTHRVVHWRTKSCVGKRRFLVSISIFLSASLRSKSKPCFYLEEVGWYLEVEANLCSWQQERSWDPG